MKSKGRSRLVEWGKSLLIVLLLISAFYLLGRTQLGGRIEDSVQGLFQGSASSSGETPVSQTSSAQVNPMRLAIYQDGRRFGVQYSKEEASAAFSAVSTLLSEALSSAGAPEEISQQTWQNALCSTGVYVDILYPLPMKILACQLGDGQENPALTGSARRICLAADGDDGVSLFYINEEDGSYYASQTTLSRSFHLDEAVEGWDPNGAMFAFELSSMSALEPYTLLTETPQPAICTAENPLLADEERVKTLLAELSFTSQGVLDPVQGGQVVEGNDTLRLSDSGVVTFHTIGDSESRFAVPEGGVQDAVAYVQAIAKATAGAWCGQADLCLTNVEETDEKIVVTFQYCINGVPVLLSGNNAAAQFSITGGVVTDFSLCLRSYAETGETSLVLPEMQAAAAMGAMDVNGKELVLIYQDGGTELVQAVWTAL